MKKLIMTALVLCALFVSAFSRAARADSGVALDALNIATNAVAQDKSFAVATATMAGYEETEEEFDIYIETETSQETEQKESAVEIEDYSVTPISASARGVIMNTSLSWDKDNNWLLFGFTMDYSFDTRCTRWTIKAGGTTVVSGTMSGTTVNHSNGIGKVKSFTCGNYKFSGTVAISGSDLTTFFKKPYIYADVWYNETGGDETTYYLEPTISAMSGYTDAYNGYLGNYLGYQYTLILDANMDNGEKLTESMECVVGDEITLPDDIFDRAGYTLSGWDTERDGSGTRYEAGETVPGFSSVDGDTVTLYAQWEEPATAPVTIYSEAAGNMASYTDEHSVRVEIYDEEDSLVETYEGDELPFEGSLVLRHGDSVTLPEVTVGYTVKLLVDDVDGYHTSQKVWSTGGRENGDEGSDTDSETGAVVSGDGLEFLLTHTKQIDVDTGIYDINEKLGIAMMLFSAVGILLIVGLGAGLRGGD